MTKEDKAYLDLLKEKIEEQHGALVTLVTTEFERVSHHLSVLNGRVGNAEQRIDRVMQVDCKEFKKHIGLSKKVLNKWPLILLVLLIISFAGAWLYDNLDLRGTIEKKADIELRVTPGGGLVR